MSASSEADNSRRETEQAFWDSEMLYQSLVDCLPQSIFRKDTEGRFTFVNQRFCRTVGRPPEEILGKTDADFYPSELAAKYREDDERVMDTLTVLDAIEENVRPNGERTYVQVIKTPLHDASGKVNGVQGIFWDVTERKRMEEAIEHERDLLQALLDSIPDAIYFKDRQSRFLRVSREMARMFGARDSSQVVGKTDFDFFGEAHARQAYEDEQRIIATGEPIVAKKELETWPDGRQTWALTTKMPLCDRNGNIIGTIGVSKDITTLVEAERQLEKARDAAVESVRLKGEFLANMSHEIRTPMHAIIGMAGLLLETELSVEQRDGAETIRRSGELLLNIINDILDFSRMEAGRMKLDHVDFDLQEVVEGTVDLLAESAHAKGVELIYCLGDALPRRLRGDPGRLGQVLTNLIGNAIKFTDRGEIVLDIQSRETTETHTTIRAEIRDTGIGIVPEAQSRIFEAFSQADGSTTRKYGGTGLGLAICKQLVELMGGEIGVRSQVGRGSTFWFTASFERQPESARAAEPSRDLLAGVRALVVDDHPLNRRLLVETLGRWRVHADEAANGAAALALLQSAVRAGAAYDLALIDMEMPEMDGLSLTEGIRADPNTSQTRLIMLTSLRDRLDVATMRSAGIAACLVKPPREGRLYDGLVKVMAAATPSGAHEPASLAARLHSPSPSATASVSLRILLAEDNLVNQRLALRQLRRLGHAADAVSNGQQVLQALERQTYDLLLLDCQMPELDGYETARAIRKQEVPISGTAGTPRRPLQIIAMTANTMEGDRERCVAAGMDDYISKPVRLPDLEAALQRASERLTADLNLPSAPSVAEPGSDEETLNLSMLRSLSELNVPGETDAVVEMAELFFQSAFPLRDGLLATAAAGDLAGFARAAHSLKGSASGLGAQRLARLCAELEQSAKAGDLASVQRDVGAASSEFEKVSLALAAATGLSVPAQARQPNPPATPH